jgi:hypothetical protein
MPKRQDQMLVLWGELPRSPGYVFYGRLQAVLTPEGALPAAAEGLEAAGAAPDAEASADLVADKGCQSRAVLKGPDGGLWRSRIAEPKPKGVEGLQVDVEAERAVYGNLARLRSGAAKDALKLRAERVERSLAHTLDRGGLRPPSMGSGSWPFRAGTRR